MRFPAFVAAIFLAAMVSACGGSDSTAPTTGTLAFHIVTTGFDIDSDGYLVDIDGQSRMIPANGTMTVEASPGTHSLAINGLAFNCDITAPASASVAVGTTTTVDVQATCVPYLRNAIVYVSEEFGGAVMAMRPDGSRRVQLTTDNQVYASPAVSPDGKSIAVAWGATWDGIYVFDRFGKTRTKLVGHGNLDAEPAWSPDGTKLAFRSLVPSPYGGNVGRIFVANSDGSGLRQLTPDVSPGHPNPYDATPSWSPDGARILFTRSGDISIINVDGTGLVSTGVDGDSPSWSADGSHIAFQSVIGGNTGGGGNVAIYTMDMTFAPHAVTTPVQSDQMPRWSPDGSQIVFARAENNVFHLYKIQADGSGLVKLSTSTLSDSWPSWTRGF